MVAWFCERVNFSLVNLLRDCPYCPFTDNGEKMEIDDENVAEKTAKDEEPMELDGNSEEKRQSLIEVKQILCPILHPGLTVREFVPSC